MINKPSPLNGDYNGDPNLKAPKKERGLSIRGLHSGCWVWGSGSRAEFGVQALGAEGSGSSFQVLSGTPPGKYDALGSYSASQTHSYTSVPGLLR